MEIRWLPAFLYPEEPESAPSWAAGGGRDGKDEDTAPTEEIGCIIGGGQEAKTGILVGVITNAGNAARAIEAFARLDF